MDFKLAPDFVAIAGLLVVFASLLRQNPQARLRYWLVGWFFVLIHFAAEFIATNIHTGADTAYAVSTVMLLLTSVAFIWAGNEMVVRGSRGALRAMFSALPDTVVCIILIYGLGSPVWYVMLALAGMFTSLWVFGGGKRRHDQMERMVRNTFIVLVYSIQAFLFLWKQWEWALVWLLFWHYLATAIVFRVRVLRVTVGAMFTTLSILAWALVFPVGMMFELWLPHVHVSGEVWNLPKYLVATGMIVTLLEEQMHQAQQASLQDALTGLANRRHFTSRIMQFIQQSSVGRPFALLVLDIDGFKQINDRLGHVVGDKVLQKVAQRMQSSFRETDVLARMGGDEFAVLLPGMRNRNALKMLLEKLKSVLRLPLRVGDDEISLRVSVGMAFCPEEGADEDALYAVADRRMYQNKHFHQGLPKSR